MKAVRFHEYGDPSVLRYEDVEQPVPGPGEARLRVAASALHPVDHGPRGAHAPGPTGPRAQGAAARPMGGLPAWQAVFDDAGLTAGQRVLISGAGRAVGGY